MCSEVKSSPMRWLKGIMLKHMHGMITCREFEEFVLSYLDGELTPKQNRVFKMHLYLCRECREYLNAYQTTIELSKQILREPSMPATDEMPDEVPEDLIKAILAAKNS